MRIGQIIRKTKETDITVNLDLDSQQKVKINTGIGFFDHMLTAFAVHSGISITVSVQGDLNVDCHHTIEDTGIAIGKAIAKALGDKGGIKRYGTAHIPMDEALGFASVDISGRPYLVFNAELISDKIGDMDTQMVEEFFRALAFNAGITLHISALYGSNDHHKCEAMFKAFAHAFKMAVKQSPASEVLSTKGII